jgi:hypothetical protein
MWRPKKEGLENNDVGLYDYLAPAKAASGSGSFDGKHKWSDETVKQLTEKYNKIPNIDKQLNEEVVKNFLTLFATEDEAKMYIKNGTWPVNLYVKNFIDSKTNLVSYYNAKQNSELKIMGVKATNQNLTQFYSNRMIYSIFIMPVERELAPLSLQYFSGALPAPPNKVPTSSSFGTDSTSSSSESDAVSMPL